ncbi:MAG: GGDEF and EAL domain-containing protein [Hyphomonas sp.]|nr:GGDEF and EAL domain-containing protein [Hyphomonas sp.]
MSQSQHTINPSPTLADAAVEAALDVLTEKEQFDLVGVLATDETAYLWDLTTDGIEWETNADQVLGVHGCEVIDSGEKFAHLIAPEHVHQRHQLFDRTVDSPVTAGLPYRLQYRLTATGTRNLPVWVEDHGRWWPGQDGRPARARGVLRIVADSYVEEQRLLYRNDYDELTGQLNRARLTDALNAVILRCSRSRTQSAFLMVAINNLAAVNETLGHQAGDEVISAVIGAIKGKLRGGDTLGRYSANKFGVILNDCGSGAMEIAAERFMRAVRETSIRAGTTPVHATVSIGGVILLDHAQTVHQALSCALQALEKAKQNRLENFVAFTPNPAVESTRQRNIAMVDDVISALEAGRMSLALQPMIGAKSRRPEIYECLLRMERPNGDMVSAGQFIEAAEQLGLSRLIDKRTLEMSIVLLKQHPDITLSVNVSSLTANEPDWIATLRRLTADDPSLTQRMIVEITETSVIIDMNMMKIFVDTLREMGCRIAIDDFGAGYTSFKNLKALKVDMVKIDGAFVKDVMSEKADQAFIGTMVDLARNFGLKTVAEWVGDEASAQFLADAGIDYLQGFYFGQPIAADAFAAAKPA